jgi:CheY-like chemotaxis protein
MDKDTEELKLLLVDDEDDFRRATSTALGRRGFSVTEAANGVEALEAIRNDRPDIVLLDLKMPGMSGIETLQEIRKQDAALPVIILTGHGDYDAAVAGIKLSIVDFLQKPIDIEQLSDRLRFFTKQGATQYLREPTIAELMVQPSLYPKVVVDEPMTSVLKVIRQAYSKLVPEESHPGQVRSALVYDRDDRFLGLVRFSDLLQLIIPPFLKDSEYSTFFTGMFLAQCKVVGRENIGRLVKKQVFVEVNAPLMEAVHLLVEHKLINIPVLESGELVGILRARDIILETVQLTGG